MHSLCHKMLATFDQTPCVSSSRFLRLDETPAVRDKPQSSSSVLSWQHQRMCRNAALFVSFVGWLSGCWHPSVTAGAISWGDLTVTAFETVTPLHTFPDVLPGTEWQPSLGKDLLQGMAGSSQVQRDQLLSGQRVPVAQRAAQVFVHLVVVTALGQPHRWHQLVGIHMSALLQQHQQPCGWGTQSRDPRRLRCRCSSSSDSSSHKLSSSTKLLTNIYGCCAQCAHS